MAHALATEFGETGGLATPAAPWSTKDSAALYRLADWGQPYFFINAGGHVAVRADADAPDAVDLTTLVREARRRRIEFPLLIRFPDILGSRVRALHRDFRAALVRTGYGNAHQAVYPVKVNPLQSVVSEILDAGREFGMGFECGSKAELAVALPHLRDERTLLVCNGVKDETMLALLVDAQRLGKNVIPVVERPAELAALESMATKRGFAPAFGVRMRLAGADSKFGVDRAELVELLKRLESAGGLHRLKLLHCHPGSQITDLAELRDAVREAAQAYATLVHRGAGLRYLDVGGGLGVDYGETDVNADSILNYTMGDYAETVAATILEVCRARCVPVPILVTESGRAIAAHHAVLIVPVLAVSERQGVTGLEHALADRILCDFSVFQSMLDHWGIGQTFPIMPIDRLDECPSRRGILVDLTCDADGRVNRYVSSSADRSILPVHPPCPDAPMYLGIFLMGAYEDIIGSNHNLLGRVSEVLVRADATQAEGFRIEKTVAATTVAGMLARVGYDAGELERSMRDIAEAGIESGALSEETARRMADRYAACLRDSTYCETGPWAGPRAGARAGPQADPRVGARVGPEPDSETDSTP